MPCTARENLAWKVLNQVRERLWKLYQQEYCKLDWTGSIRYKVDAVFCCNAVAGLFCSDLWDTYIEGIICGDQSIDAYIENIGCADKGTDDSEGPWRKPRGL